ncbi:uncharacterized protein CC84DRAFT_416286 [Paraphaeosphaeria sporulosa]|uniref:Uncharacterized protein n=1 Tax=Paraphaeosphaeria sporulosa TaxID=1460663 RepID=A0A177BVY7_9PLEO|nr:uncharacterized protein CC84DRAFT_416286 [Paraphaeosphaeria sporulosa]OAF99100.1 hypothetical protein CC84DRAFT_416286 [Paraphaeosphaeria sporulosa]
MPPLIMALQCVCRGAWFPMHNPILEEDERQPKLPPHPLHPWPSPCSCKLAQAHSRTLRLCGFTLGEMLPFGSARRVLFHKGVCRGGYP